MLAVDMRFSPQRQCALRGNSLWAAAQHRHPRGRRTGPRAALAERPERGDYSRRFGVHPRHVGWYLV